MLPRPQRSLVFIALPGSGSSKEAPAFPPADTPRLLGPSAADSPPPAAGSRRHSLRSVAATRGGGDQAGPTQQAPLPFHGLCSATAVRHATVMQRLAGSSGERRWSRPQPTAAPPPRTNPWPPKAPSHLLRSVAILLSLDHASEQRGQAHGGSLDVGGASSRWRRWRAPGTSALSCGLDGAAQRPCKQPLSPPRLHPRAPQPPAPPDLLLLVALALLRITLALLAVRLAVHGDARSQALLAFSYRY